MVIAWNGFNAEGKDIGSEVGDQSVRFLVFNHTIEVTTEQSSSFGAHDQIMSQLSAEPACDADATPPYSGTGDGGDGFLAWQDGVPTSHGWGPNVAPFSVSLPNCDGGTIPVSYELGHRSSGTSARRIRARAPGSTCTTASFPRAEPSLRVRQGHLGFRLHLHSEQLVGEFGRSRWTRTRAPGWKIAKEWITCARQPGRLWTTCIRAWKR